MVSRNFKGVKMSLKERPILMSAPMVRAIRDGRKTITRRVIKNQRLTNAPLGVFKAYETENSNGDTVFGFNSDEDTWVSPFGKPGDRLWVRENYRFSSAHNKLKPSQVPAGDAVEYFADTTARHYLDGKQRPSIFMPRWASRITLEITSIHVERLNDISEADAVAEGGTWTDNGPREWARLRGLSFDQANPVNGWNEGWSHTGETDKTRCLQSAKSSFANLWESINGEGSWDLNPWVWCVIFKKIRRVVK